VLPNPEPCEVVDAGGRPVDVDGRGVVSAAPVTVRVGGQRAPIAEWAGPWPIAERWWDPDHAICPSIRD
jgi:protein ImuB